MHKFFHLLTACWHGVGYNYTKIPHGSFEPYIKVGTIERCCICEKEKLTANFLSVYSIDSAKSLFDYSGESVRYTK